MASISAPARRDGRDWPHRPGSWSKYIRSLPNRGISRPRAPNTSTYRTVAPQVGNWCASRPLTRGRATSMIVASVVKWFGPSCRRGYWRRYPGGWLSAGGCEVVGALLQEGFEAVTDHVILWDEPAVAGVEPSRRGGRWARLELVRRVRRVRRRRSIAGSGSRLRLRRSPRGSGRRGRGPGYRS
jgi:hypothetical protein